MARVGSTLSLALDQRPEGGLSISLDRPRRVNDHQKIACKTELQWASSAEVLGDVRWPAPIDERRVLRAFEGGKRATSTKKRASLPTNGHLRPGVRLPEPTIGA